MNRKLLGEILVDSNYLTSEQLQQALRIQEKQGGKIGEILVRLNLVDEKIIADIVSQQRDFKRIDLDPKKIDRRLLSMVPRNVCRQYRIIPYMIENNMLVLAMDDPLNKFAIETVEFVTNYKVIPGIAEPSKIEELLNLIYGGTPNEKERKPGIIQAFDVTDKEISILRCSQESIIEDVNSVIETALLNKASAVHIESTAGETRVRYRINGVLTDKYSIETGNGQRAIARLRIMANLDDRIPDIEQTGAFAVENRGREIIFKVHLIPTITGEDAVIRLIDEAGPLKTLEELGLSPHELAVVIENIFKPGGLVLICGPSDIGKTTTLYAILRKLACSEKKIFTIEHQTEKTLDFASQIRIDFDKGIDYETALNRILRMDPDIVMIDEIANSKMAELAVRAAYTGKTVITTLYTRDCFEGITRLIDYGIDPFIIADSVNIVISQRLVRTLCKSCRQASKLNDGRIVYNPKACEDCSWTGYASRTGVFELIPGQDLTREVVFTTSDVESLATKLRDKGVGTLWQKAVKKVLAGDTSLTEIIRTIPKMPWD
jgi:type IV pilus assembly protein PilB